MRGNLAAPGGGIEKKQRWEGACRTGWVGVASPLLPDRREPLALTMGDIVCRRLVGFLVMMRPVKGMRSFVSTS